MNYLGEVFDVLDLDLCKLIGHLSLALGIISVSIDYFGTLYMM